MPRIHITKLPGLFLFMLMIGVPATGCAAHPHHHTVVTHHVHKAPPAPRREVVIARPSQGHVWVAGHYVWRPANSRYVWVDGRWSKPPRRGAVWVAPRVEVRRGRTVFVAGYWRR